MKEYTIYTDGSCLNNPGAGGWAAIIIDNATGEREEISGGSADTTNNRMELLAVISALRKLKKGDAAEIFTDSTYVQNAIVKGWLKNWKCNGWLTTAKKPVQNQEMWIALDKLIADKNINFKWLKGHAGNTFNEWCDKLAFTAAKKSLLMKNTNELKQFGSTENVIEDNKNLPSSKIKIARKLQIKKHREELGLFIAEGMRLCEMAINSAEIEFGFYTEEFLKTPRAGSLVKKLEKVATMHKIPSQDFDKIRDTITPQGIMIIAKQKNFQPVELLQKNFIIALDGVQDPGNVGTILRTAEAFNCAVILLDGTVDIYNPKVVRSTMGAIFNLPTLELSTKAFLNLMRENQFEVTAADLDQTAKSYYKHNFKKKSAVVFGNEGAGVSAKISDATEKIYIPMTGSAESLNVATAVAIITAEAARQNYGGI